MKTAIVALVVALLSGCGAKAIETSATENAEIRVDKLFTKDGCTVYRFYDSGSKYFVRCDGAASTSTQWSETCGKGCTRNVQVPGG